MVRARSAAEIPVSTPSAASMDMVKLVPKRVPLRQAMRGKSNCRQRSSVSVRHTRPRAWVTMKLIASGVKNSAAMTRSNLKNMSRLNQSGRLGIARHGHLDGARAVGRRNTGIYAFGRFDGHGEIGTETGTVAAGHEGQVQLPAAFFG